MDLDIDLTEDGIFLNASKFDEVKEVAKTPVTNIRTFGFKEDRFAFIKDKFIEVKSNYDLDETIPTGTWDERTAKIRIAERIGNPRHETTCPRCGRYDGMSSWETDVCENCYNDNDKQQALESIKER